MALLPLAVGLPRVYALGSSRMTGSKE